MRTSMLFVLLAAPMFAVSAGPVRGDNRDVPPPPSPPPGYRGDSTPPPVERNNSAPREDTEPDITITTRGTDRVEEYRYNGQLYMIKITPKHGVPYYLIDEEGRGQFKRSDLQPDVKPPMWVLKRF